MRILLVMVSSSTEREKELNQAMSAAIRARRAVRRITVTDLAAQVGLPVRTLTRYLSGQGALNYGTLVLIAEAMETTVESLAHDAMTMAKDGVIPG